MEMININIEDILRTEIDKEQSIISTLKKTNLDTQSRQQVLNRTYGSYEQIKQLIALQEH